MLAMEEILCELERYDMNEQGLPPGFRFHPTDEELITFYLVSKVFNGTFCGVNIAEVDLNRCEPWELPDVAKMGEREWYFFSLRDRKYPTGLRTNRATRAGYWKATGKDREVYSNGGAVVGMKKTLVFYRGRAPRGEKTKWVMHEYRLDGDLSCRHACKEEWVICRIYHKLVEKKNPALLYQNYCINKPTLSCSSSSPLTTGSYSLPPLLESSSCQDPLQNTLQNQNPFLINHRQEITDLKSVINPNYFPLNISPNSAIGAINQLDSLLFSHDQARINPSADMRWGSEQILEGYQNPLGIGGIFGVPLAANYSNGMEDFKFNREGLEMVIDHPVGDSCPMDH